jgi:hypothetical protein
MSPCFVGLPRPQAGSAVSYTNDSPADRHGCGAESAKHGAARWRSRRRGRVACARPPRTPARCSGSSRPRAGTTSPLDPEVDIHQATTPKHALGAARMGATRGEPAGVRSGGSAERLLRVLHARVRALCQMRARSGGFLRLLAGSSGRTVLVAVCGWSRVRCGVRRRGLDRRRLLVYLLHLEGRARLPRAPRSPHATTLRSSTVGRPTRSSRHPS